MLYVVQSHVHEFLSKCENEGINVLIYCTKRERSEQEAEYAKGRTKPGKIVTYAPPGCSFHEYGVAFDHVPILNGRLVWEDGLTPEEEKLWTRCGEIAESCGFTWGGRWAGRKRDMPHCQYTQGMTIQDFIAGKRPTA